MTFIIEHLEPELFPWCILEYKHISSFVSQKKLWITNVSNNKKLASYATVFKKSVTTMNLNNVCVLDPNAKKELTPTDAKTFNYFIFGGILGDNPPRSRTKELLRGTLKHAITRNLGTAQMATDNAVNVVKQILAGKKLSDLNFTENIELPIHNNESIILPYKYILVKGKPLISPALIKKLKQQKEF